MIFAKRPLLETPGAYLAHSLRVGKKRFKKGHLITREDVAVFAEADIRALTIARLEEGDIHEDEAANRIAAAISGDRLRLDPPFTGRVNFFAQEAGMLEVDEDGINRLNRLDPSITLATLSNYTRLEGGRMVATLKIIPFAAPLAAVEQAERMTDLIKVRAFQPKRIALIATRLNSLKQATMEKTSRILSQRLARSGSKIVREYRVAHDEQSVGEAFAKALQERPDLIICFGASANVDVGDVGPAGLLAAGGALHHFGMPVDPGNLLYLGELSGIPVVGAPGCARSPAENGFDWVLDRLLAGVRVTPEMIVGMGVGGLLMEIHSRPQPREMKEAVTFGEEKIAAIVLAAGRSTRMGKTNKLLAKVEGESLVRRVISSLQKSNVDEIFVVTGHEAEGVGDEIAEFPVKIVHNPDYADGLSTSLRAGIKALSEESDAALVVLGDMPFIGAEAFNRLIDAYKADEKTQAIVATANGKRGNPVLWGRRFFEELKTIHGDTGARHLIGKHQSVIAEVEIGEAAAFDLDTPEALKAAGGVLAEEKED